jgi:DNA-binding GntR family transcriptional regulator
VASPREPEALKCHHGLRRQTIVESLLADVFHGRLRAGEHLVTQDLAQRFGVSHTPIREALISLAGVGVIDLLPNRGAVVRHISAREVREVCQVRQVLECAATRSACGRIDADLLEVMADNIRRFLAQEGRPGSRYIDQAREIDSRLHDTIGESCGNAFLGKELGRLKILFRTFRDTAWEREDARRDYRRVFEEAHEHLAIVEALRAHDGKRAARAMARHIRSGARYWTRTISETRPPAPARGMDKD